MKLIIKNLITPLTEQNKKDINTLGSDVNEILLGYYSGGGNWSIYGSQQNEAIQALEMRKSQINPENYKDQDGRAQAQAEAALNWASANGFEGDVEQVWWTARPGILSKAVETDVDSRKNPTDILLKFSNDAFLGLSAKSTKGGGDIGFKNPGIGRLGKDLGVDLVGATKKIYQDNLTSLSWGGEKTTRGRKQYLKNIAAGRKMGSVPELVSYYKGGTNVLSRLRDLLYDYYLEMDLDDLKEHFLDEWIDAKDRFPYYIKVTGRGTNGNYSASVVDSINNDTVKSISSEPIELEKIGTNSIGVWAGEGSESAKLFKIRFKWESAPLASSIKMSGDPF
jgi:hypothetical protein